MATVSISKVVGKNSTKFKARVRITAKGKTVHEESKSFVKMSQAESWAKRTKMKLESDGAPRKNNSIRRTVGELIIMYLNDPLTAENMGRTKEYVLLSLLHYDIAAIYADELTANDLIVHCRTRLSEPNKPLPQTVYHDVTYLKSVIEVGETLFNTPCSIDYHIKAIPTLVKLKLIGRSSRRTRVPTVDELVSMRKGLTNRQSHRSAKIPLVDIFEMSLDTAMRVGEITDLKWSDFNITKKTITIRDRKDPRNKIGNDHTIPLLGNAMNIITKMPKIEGENRIFPYNSRSISAAWQRVSENLGIEDLHYHDLRAESAIRLFIAGYNIVEVSKITGHKDLNILNNIYLRITPEMIKERKSKLQLTNI